MSAVVPLVAMTVLCGSCGKQMCHAKIVAHVIQPQHNGVRPYRIDRWECDTPDCGGVVELEVDEPYD